MKAKLITFASITVVLFFAAPLMTSAQPAARIPNVGALYTGMSTGTSSLSEGLAALGYVEGKTITLHLRYSEGRVDRLPALAAELVRMNVDVIVAWGVEPLEAVRKATNRIPIVMVAGSDPVATGLAASLAKPRGNITGVTVGEAELAAKRLQLLREALPHVSRVAILRDPNADPALVPQLAVSNRLPAVGSWKSSPVAGFLMSYGPEQSDLFRRAATYVDKILKGARPADLPIEQPTKFELVINLNAARALGLKMPPSLLQRADQVIE